MKFKKSSFRSRITASLLLSIGSTGLAQSVQTPAGAAPTSAPSAAAELPEGPKPQLKIAPTASSSSSIHAEDQDVTLANLPGSLLDDQKAIWTGPFHTRPADAAWLLPLSVGTGLLLGSDQHTMNSLIHTNSTAQNRADKFSQGGLIGLSALPAGMFLWSLGHNAPQAHETSLLAGEALADSLVVNQAIKLTFRRDRPSISNAQGSFFSSSPLDSSFASNHATAAWAMASVIGEEYPSWITRTAVYGLAAGVSASRVIADQHFPSDVLVGSATGWLIGHYVYRAHHNFSLNIFQPAPMPGEAGSERRRLQRQSTIHLPPDPLPQRPPVAFEADPDTMGSTNVPMDSWIYPALERLSSMGFIPGQSASIRPWTRQECLRQLNVAEEFASAPDAFSPALVREAWRLMNDLHFELASEPPSYKSLDLESVYARVGAIAGPALTDGYHFGQTWWNDFGRPLGRGTSAIAGYSLRAHHGRFFLYDRQEIQHGPGVVAETPEINRLFNSTDRISASAPTIAPIPASAAYDRQRPIELYAGVAFAGNEVSLGKQELYWGPTTMGPLSFSSNAEPTYNLRFVANRPHPLPFFPSLGTYRFDIVLGKLSGHSYPARPWFNGQKVALNFGDNLEVSFTRWSLFWGVGHPITLHSFRANLISFNSTGSYSGNAGSAYGDRTDPGDRKSNFDFRYRLPGLRKIVTLYADAYSDDDPSPIDAPRRAVWSPGIYLAHVPFLPHMDLRVEATSSTGLATDFGGGHFFINGVYLDANTNKGFILGNATGRDARAIEARTNYWFSARTKVEAGYRQNKGGSRFLPGGATITDGFINWSYAINPLLRAEVFTQYERFLVPSYLPGSQHNVSARFQLTWEPKLHFRR